MMKSLLYKITKPYPAPALFHFTILAFRIMAAVELMVVHGLKKIGVGVEVAETIPNPMHLPDFFNQAFAVGANLIAPIFVILGLFTKLSIVPVLAVTVTGYFVLHWHDTLLVKDVPFIYSLIFMLIWMLGPGKYSLDYLINRKLIT